MVRLVLYLTIIGLIIMHVHVNESKPIFIPLSFLEQSWPKDMEHLVCKINRKKVNEYFFQEQADVPVATDEQFLETDRRKRSKEFFENKNFNFQYLDCLTYPSKQSHRASKWMCW
jgi:hypothetical protein